jgi:hypothetical protein
MQKKEKKKKEIKQNKMKLSFHVVFFREDVRECSTIIAVQ